MVFDLMSLPVQQISQHGISWEVENPGYQVQVYVLDRSWIPPVSLTRNLYSEWMVYMYSNSWIQWYTICQFRRRVTSLVDCGSHPFVYGTFQRRFHSLSCHIEDWTTSLWECVNKLHNINTSWYQPRAQYSFGSQLSCSRKSRWWNRYCIIF